MDEKVTIHGHFTEVPRSDFDEDGNEFRIVEFYDENGVLIDALIE